jgi:hypothetical protein
MLVINERTNKMEKVEMCFIRVGTGYRMMDHRLFLVYSGHVMLCIDLEHVQ